MKKPTPIIRRKHKSTQPKLSRDVLPINPDFFYRLIEGPKYYGYKLTTQTEKIKTGDIPAPVSCRIYPTPLMKLLILSQHHVASSGMRPSPTVRMAQRMKEKQCRASIS